MRTPVVQHRPVGATIGQKAYIAVVRNHFFGSNSRKPEPIGTNFTGRRTVTWHAALQTFVALRQTGAKWQRNKRILPNVLSKQPHRFAHFPTADLNTERESLSS